MMLSLRIIINIVPERPMPSVRAALAVTLLLAPLPSLAGNAGFFTTYTSEVEKGEVELMLMNDLTLPATAREAQGTYVSQMFEIEYGVTSQYATELMVEGFADLRSHEVSFTGVRWENRYRLFERPVPLNPMIYFEYEDLAPNTRYKMEVSGWVRPPYSAPEEPERRERILESRIVLSEQLGAFSVAANAIFETDLHSLDTALGYTAGVMWMPGHANHGGWHCACATEMEGCGCSHCAGGEGPCTCSHASSVALGLELFGGLGDTRSFGLVPSRQEHYLAPVLVWHATPRWMVHAQIAKGLTRVSDDLFRVNVAYEF